MNVSELVSRLCAVDAALADEVAALGAALAHTQALVRGLRGPLRDPHRTTIELARAVRRVILRAAD